MSSTDHGAHAAPAHGHDDHGHAADHLGPIDWKMWLTGLVGVAAALVVVAALVIATGFTFNA